MALEVRRYLARVLCLQTVGGAHFQESLFRVGLGFPQQEKGVVLGYPIEQLILDLLVWLPGRRVEKELLEPLEETAKG